jgi:hypothetical protein
MSDIFDFLQNIPIATAVDPCMFVVLVLLACGRHGLFRCNYLRNTATFDIKHFGNAVITESMYMQCFHYVITAWPAKAQLAYACSLLQAWLQLYHLKTPDNNTTRFVGIEVSAVGEWAWWILRGNPAIIYSSQASHLNLQRTDITQDSCSQAAHICVRTSCVTAHLTPYMHVHTRTCKCKYSRLFTNTVNEEWWEYTGHVAQCMPHATGCHIAVCNTDVI